MILVVHRIAFITILFILYCIGINITNLCAKVREAAKYKQAIEKISQDLNQSNKTGILPVKPNKAI